MTTLMTVLAVLAAVTGGTAVLLGASTRGDDPERRARRDARLAEELAASR